jgi:hypothetical protein
MIENEPLGTDLVRGSIICHQASEPELMLVERDLQGPQKVIVAHVESTATNIYGDNYGSEGLGFESLRLRCWLLATYGKSAWRM